MKKYYKIGEISKLYKIGIDSLRYYEELGLITPIRSESGYRLYSANDIWRLNIIRDLRELEFDMKSIKNYLENRSIDTTLDLLELENQAIKEKIKSLNELRSNVKERMKNIKSSRLLNEGTIELKSFKDRKCFSISEGYNKDSEMDILIKKLVNIDSKYFYIIGNNQIGTRIDLDNSTYKSVFILDDDGTEIIPKGEYICVSYNGKYNKSFDYLNQIKEYAKVHNLKIIDDVLELLWIDIHTTSNENEYVTELQVRVIIDK